jgi:hypothetical protein
LRLNSFDLDICYRHGCFPRYATEPSAHLVERLAVVQQALLQLGCPDPQYAAQFSRSIPSFNSAADLLQREGKVLDRDEPREARQLRGLVVAVPGHGIDV